MNKEYIDILRMSQKIDSYERVSIVSMSIMYTLMVLSMVIGFINWLTMNPDIKSGYENIFVLVILLALLAAIILFISVNLTKTLTNDLEIVQAKARNGELESVTDLINGIRVVDCECELCKQKEEE